jgi:hypothetical protein
VSAKKNTAEIKARPALTKRRRPGRHAKTTPKAMKKQTFFTQGCTRG